VRAHTHAHRSHTFHHCRCPPRRQRSPQRREEINRTVSLSSSAPISIACRCTRFSFPGVSLKWSTKMRGLKQGGTPASLAAVLVDVHGKQLPVVDGHTHEVYFLGRRGVLLVELEGKRDADCEDGPSG